MARVKGVKNRNYPPLTLDQALRVARALDEKAAGMTVSKLTLAELLGVSPSSSAFGNLVASSRMYGLSTGGINSSEFKLTSLGENAVGADEVSQTKALKQAVLNVEPYRAFFLQFNGKKFPAVAAAREFLKVSAEVPSERVDECIQFISSDAATAGFIKNLSGSDWVDLEEVPAFEAVVPAEGATEESNGHVDLEGLGKATPIVAPEAEPPKPLAHAQAPNPGKKVFVAHGSNRVPLDQLKKALDQIKVPYAVAVDEPNKGRPISKKVAQLMQDECSSGIFIFTADEQFFQEDEDGTKTEVWRPRENVVYELGAASILYENRIVIFKERGVSFPSDFADLGYIEFEKDQLTTEIASLFQELVALDILEVRAKG